MFIYKLFSLKYNVSTNNYLQQLFGSIIIYNFIENKII